MIDCLKKNLFRLHGQNARVKRSDSDSSTTSGSKTSYPETALAPISRKSLGAIALCVSTALRPYRIKPSARWLLNGLDTAWNSLTPCAAMCMTSRFAPSPATTAWLTSPIPRTGAQQPQPQNYLSFSFSRAVFLTERDADQTAPQLATRSRCRSSMVAESSWSCRCA